MSSKQSLEIYNHLLKDKRFRIFREEIIGDGKLRDKRDLKFDYKLIYERNGNFGFIEVDGKQHFVIEAFQRNEEEFKTGKKHDRMRNEYCRKNNKLLARIGYLDKKED